MKKIIALALGFCLWAAPAFAGIAIISGTATNGAQTAITFNAGTALALQPTSSIPSGSLVLMFMSNNTGGSATTGWNCADTKSNTYHNVGGPSAVTAAGVETNWSFLTSGLTTSDTVTCTQISGPSGIAGQMAAFSGVASQDSVATPSGFSTTTSSTSITVGPSGTLNSPCPGTGCALLTCNTLWRNTGTIGVDANFTPFTSGASQAAGIGYWIVSATTARSCTNTNTTSDRNAGDLIVFKASASATTTPAGLTTLGAGP